MLLLPVKFGNVFVSCTALVKLCQLFSGLTLGNQTVFTTKLFATWSGVFTHYVFLVVIVYIVCLLLSL